MGFSTIRTTPGPYRGEDDESVGDDGSLAISHTCLQILPARLANLTTYAGFFGPNFSLSSQPSVEWWETSKTHKEIWVFQLDKEKKKTLKSLTTSNAEAPAELIWNPTGNDSSAPLSSAGLSGGLASKEKI